MDLAASVAAASAASSGLGGLCGSAGLQEEPLNNSLREGFPSAAAAAAAAAGRRGAGPPPRGVPPHPLELQQKQLLRAAEQQELQRAAAAFGSYAALRIKTERELCATAQRLPGLPSSLWGLQTLMGLDISISPQDYLGRDKPDLEGGPLLTLHDRIEGAMGI
ncbi:hypothetical protein, conserved [Eimeria tenella]|uniref:Uncharacterized protein n=1 Tax=Eimeria tenella TaxID=5802 RepID=U6KJZ1_EIMTE|nr:hypothetical protein, conserved [Eimeria tenella]CDJ37126.1 hypothetical protein, conserved [Eimeria tenella]|eukprot:XP_013227964.1 hypothetical protein, conserved [Eimeria tenella]